MNDGASATLRDFIDNRWAAVRRNNARFRDCYELRHRLADVSSREAAWFLEAIALHGDEPPLYRVQDDNKHPSRRIPPNAGGGPRGNVFFEKPGPYGSLRLETIVHQAAAWRLHDEFAWPLSHLVIESPDIVDDRGSPLLRREALDILLLEQPCPELPSRMTLRAARSRIGIEVKADANELGRLLNAMRDCQQSRIAPDDFRHRQDHKKCSALDLLRPQFFLGIGACETWRLFPLIDCGGRAAFGEERSGLDDLMW